MLNISVYSKSPLPEMRELIKVAKNNMEEHGVNFVRATVENNILDKIIAGKILCSCYCKVHEMFYVTKAREDWSTQNGLW